MAQGNTSLHGWPMRIEVPQLGAAMSSLNYHGTYMYIEWNSVMTRFPDCWKNSPLGQLAFILFYREASC